jgi:hypothetical protein
MTGISAEISVIAPIQPAIERARDLLFRPFQLARWFPIGFCAWLAGLGEAGTAGYRAGIPFPPSTQPAHFGAPFAPTAGPGGTAEWWQHVRGELMENLYWILPLAVVLFCVIVCFTLLLVWLSCRGQFMFLHCVALDRAEVAVPWRQHARAARSLFFFRLVLGLIGTVPMLALLAAIALSLFRIFGQGDTSAWLLLLPAALALFGVGLSFVVIAKLTDDLVVPIMFLRGGTCREAWRELLGLYGGQAGALIVYLLFQIVLGFLVGATIAVAMLATCCLLGCLLILPYLGTVALLPILVFQRSYSLYYLRQFGPRYDVFQPFAPPASSHA